MSKTKRNPLGQLHPFSFIQAPSSLDDDFEERAFGEAVAMTLEAWTNLLEKRLSDAGIDTDREDGNYLHWLKLHSPQNKSAWIALRDIKSLTKALQNQEPTDMAVYRMMWIGYEIQKIELAAILQEYETLLEGAELPEHNQDQVAALRSRLEAELEAADRQQRGLRDEIEKSRAIRNDRAAKATELKNEGWTHASIALELGISERTVTRYINAKK